MAKGGFGLGWVIERLKVEHKADKQCSTNPVALALLPPLDVHNDKTKVQSLLNFFLIVKV